MRATGWWAPAPLERRDVRAHYLLPDGWSLCGRWRRPLQGEHTFAEEIRDVAVADERALCRACLERSRARGKKSKLFVALRGREPISHAAH
jgi:hypothetical protein